MRVFLDLECIPSTHPDIMEYLKKIARKKCVAKMTKQDSIDKRLAEFDANPEPFVKEIHEATALDGAFGEVIAIGFAVDDDGIQSWSRMLGENEGEIIKGFFDDVLPSLSGHQLVIVGHNVEKFDLKFLQQRCIVNKIEYPHQFGNARVFDTQLEWGDKYDKSKYPSLEKLCVALGIEHDDSFTGADVWEAVREGAYDKVIAHVTDDVEAVREVYNRMVGGV